MAFVEAITNVGVGYAIAVVAQIIVLPLFGLRLSLDNLMVGALFTVLSIVRSYCLRRLFERVRHRV